MLKMAPENAPLEREFSYADDINQSPKSKSTSIIMRNQATKVYTGSGMKKKKISVGEIEDDFAISLEQSVKYLNTLDIWLHKKGGEFDIFNGKLVVAPGNFSPKKDFITVKRVTGTERQQYVPTLEKYEKVNGDVYCFSTNRRHLRTAVDLWLPCLPITHPQLQEIKLKAKYKGEDEWVYHDWNLYSSDPNKPIMQFNTDRLGTFIPTLEPRTERLVLTNQGLLYSARINRYISLRFPKKCVDSDLPVSIKIFPMNVAKALVVKEEFKQEYPDLNDLQLITDYFDITAPSNIVFKRPISIKLPTNNEGFIEEHRDEIIILRKDVETQEWSAIDSHVKITKTTVSFDTKQLGRFVICRAPAKRKLRMLKAVPILERKMSLSRKEILIFKKMTKKCWNFWVELVRPSEVSTIIELRESEGLVLVSSPEIISKDLDNETEEDFSHPLKPGVSSRHQPVGLTESELEFQRNGLEPVERVDSWRAVNIYEISSEEKLLRKKKKARRDEVEEKSNYIECEDNNVVAEVRLRGPIQMVETVNPVIYFLEKLPDNYVVFEFEPTEESFDMDVEAAITVVGSSVNALDGTKTKHTFKDVKFIITAQQITEYFWVEQEPEPEIEPVLETLSELPTPVTSEEKMKSVVTLQERMRRESGVSERLSAPIKPRQIIYREPRVLSGRSLQVLSKHVEEGLTLAVYLDIPDSTITGIGFDALSNGLSLPEVTYRILLRWKRTSRSRGEQAVEELARALRGMGRHDIVSVVWECHCKNQEMTPESFAHLDNDEDEDESSVNRVTKVNIGGL